MRQNCVESASPQITIRRMRHAWGMPKSPNKETLSQYVILNAFPLQIWEQKRASMLRYTYIV